MKAKLTFLSLILFSVTSLYAQTISVTHLFPGEQVPYVSKGNQKLAWVSKIGNYYASNFMDSLQNIVTNVDTNLFAISGGFPANGGGVTLCGSTINSNDNLVGLFYDWDCWQDTSMIVGIHFGNGCYFLYDFATQQRNYFYFNTPTFVEPSDMGADCDYHFNWKNDTLIISLQFTDILGTGSGNHGNCLKFVNYQLIEQGQLIVSDYVVDVFLDPSGKLNQIYDSPWGGYWLQNDGVNYYNDLTPSGTTYFGDAYVNANDMYILQNHFLTIGESDSIKHYNGTTIQSIMASPMTGVYSYKVLCKDHAGRLWVATKDSVYMYNGTNWLSFGFGGINLANQLVNPTPMKSFIEYKSNCFALSFADDLMSVGGNGMLLFCYSDSNTVTTTVNQNRDDSNKFYPNPVSDIIYSNSLTPNDKVVIYNLLGEKIVEQTVLQNSLNLDISNVPSGIYFIEVSQQNKLKFIQKINITKN
jgi:hypothetical protein